jgi:hypothetical protein
MWKNMDEDGRTDYEAKQIQELKVSHLMEYVFLR